MAAQYDRSAATGQRCTLHDACLERHAASADVTVYHRLGPTHPAAGPSAVRWRANASLVVASYSGRLWWLSNLRVPLDLVVYQKVNGFGGPEVARRFREARDAACASGRCERLAYYRVLPNFGRTTGTARGGSREPFAYLTFLTEFYAALPAAVIFAQDDCWKSWACPVYNGPRLPLAAALANMPAVWGRSTARPDAQSCFCTLRDESFQQAPLGSFEGALWPLMRFVWTFFFGLEVDDVAGRRTTWAQTATFAIGRDQIRLRPRGFYQLLRRLATVEGACGGAGTWTWANAFERLWLDLFDPNMGLAPHLVQSTHKPLELTRAARLMIAACRRGRASPRAS